MFLAYFDDSGERGITILACVIVHDDNWDDLHTAWMDYRRWLRDNYGIPIQKQHGRRRPHVELKATDFANGSGPWRGRRVSRSGRLRAMRVALGLIGRHADVFAVAWDPDRKMGPGWAKNHRGPMLDVWVTCLERLATFSKKHSEHPNDRVMAIVDQGHIAHFRREFRRMRRFHYVGSTKGGTLAAHAPMFIDDPSERDSQESVFVQMADLAAYAALRELRPTADISGLWRAIGEGILTDVNKLMTGQPPGIKLIPE